MCCRSHYDNVVWNELLKLFYNHTPGKESVFWTRMSTPAVCLLWSDKSLLIASISRVVGGGELCMYVCMDVPNRPAAISPHIRFDGSAAHLRAAGVKKKDSQHMYQEPGESCVIV